MSTVTTSKKKKPAKPYPDFPLFAHATGYWAKKIRGRTHYFGKWGDWEGALRTYKEERDDLYAGRDPRARKGELLLADLCNTYLNDKQREVDADQLSRAHFKDLHETCARLIAEFGRDRAVTSLAATEFSALRAKLQKSWAPTTLMGEAGRVQAVFNYAYKTELLAHPLRAAKSFSRPSSKSLRLHRQSMAKKFFTAEEVNRMLQAAQGSLKAFIYLGINCGFGNYDCGCVTKEAFDLENGWLEFPRSKTAVERRCWLWPETVEAVRNAMAIRPKPRRKEHSHLAFLTPRGTPWNTGTNSNPVGRVFRELQKLECVKTYRPGVGFYALRHTFATIAEGSRDQIATEAIMGHVDGSMAANYREFIDDSRLRAVAEHVRNWRLAAQSSDADKEAA
ncbi:tyrosine-type recombinase/integrase [Aeoliella sp.]|uniref:tyrosine-type recombinase/integrase n=1 Tax=Aeoliella sp. TaxID=2795800 RepID=UPI003CCBCC7D